MGLEGGESGGGTALKGCRYATWSIGRSCAVSHRRFSSPPMSGESPPEGSERAERWSPVPRAKVVRSPDADNRCAVETGRLNARKP